MAELVAEGLVLRRRPYGESSLIVAVLTREAGLVHLVVRGGAGRSRAGRGAIDLLRLLQVRWRPRPGRDLHTALGVEVLDSFEAVAREPELFGLVGWLSRYLLNHCESDGQHPQTFAALLGLLRRIRNGKAPSPRACWTAMMFCIAREEGILPNHSPEADARFEEIIASLCDPDAAFPRYDRETWGRLQEWCGTVYRHSDMQLPEGWLDFGD